MGAEMRTTATGLFVLGTIDVPFTLEEKMRLNKKIVFFCLFLPFMVACATQNISNRYFANPDINSSYQDLLDARYECAIETSARSSSASATVNADAGRGASSSASQVLPSCSLFKACLSVKGWIKVDGVNLDDPNRVRGFHVPDSLGMNCY